MRTAKAVKAKRNFVALHSCRTQSPPSPPHPCSTPTYSPDDELRKLRIQISGTQSQSEFRQELREKE